MFNLTKRHLLLLAFGFLLLTGAEATRSEENKKHEVLVVAQRSVAGDSTDTQIEPVTMAILGGVAALGSVLSVGKNIHGVITNKNDLAALQSLLGKFGDVNNAGCTLLQTAGEMLFQDLNELQGLQSSQNCSSHKIHKYKEFLKIELEGESKNIMDVSNRGKFKVAYVDGFDILFSKVCHMDHDGSLLEQKQNMLQQLWRMDGLMQGICGQRMPALTGSKSLLQAASGGHASTEAILETLGLVFIVIAYADMSVSVGESAIKYMGKSSTEMITTFLEDQMEKTTTMLCEQMRGLWGSYSTRLRVRRAVLRTGIDMNILQAGVPAHAVPLVLDQASISMFPWTLQEDTLWLCHDTKRCLQPYNSEFARSASRAKLQVGEHFPSHCLKHHYSVDKHEQAHMVAVCPNRPEVVELAVPESCFAIISVAKQISLENGGIDKVEGVFWALKFYPSTLDYAWFKSPPNLTQCDAPLKQLRESSVEFPDAGKAFAQYCPS
mmetsp:Transcript_70521/g.139949  ORF Transcript_70521/g.139949 Transcript_70521/m.139949 type:complete len:493 (+) Transcript_70521:94-1572(+)